MPVAAEIYFRSFEGGSSPSSPEVVLLHGAGGDHLYWPPQIRRLHGYRVYALDLPGHGRSAGAGFQTIADYAQAVRRWMQEVGILRASVIGHSMGGAIAQMLALTFPEQVSALGLIATAPQLPVNATLLEASSHPSMFGKAVNMLVQWSFSPSAAQDLIELASRRLMEVRPALLHADLIACNHFDLRDQLAGISQPVLVICGDQDKMTPLRSARLLAESIPRAELKVVPQAGHMVMLERPVEVAELLAAFLHRLDHPSDSRA